MSTDTIFSKFSHPRPSSGKEWYDLINTALQRTQILECHSYNKCKRMNGRVSMHSFQFSVWWRLLHILVFFCIINNTCLWFRWQCSRSETSVAGIAIRVWGDNYCSANNKNCFPLQKASEPHCTIGQLYFLYPRAYVLEHTLSNTKYGWVAKKRNRTYQQMNSPDF